MNKPFKTLDEQFDILVSHNLSVHKFFKSKKRVKKSIKDVLIEKNYFSLINSYEDLFLKNAQELIESNADDSIHKIYFDNIFISDFLNIYKFDLKLAGNLFFDIHNIEVALRTKFAYYFCKKAISLNNMQPLFYEDETNYDEPSILTKKKKNVYVRMKATRFTSGNIKVTDKYISMSGDFSGKFFNSYQMSLQGACFKVYKNKFPEDYSNLLNSLNSKYNQSGSDWHYLLRNGTNSFHFRTDFSGNRYVQGFMSDISYSNCAKLEHRYISKYTEPPLWIIVNTLTIGQLIHIFHVLPIDVKDKIFKEMSYCDSIDKFEDTLTILVNLRNFVYHHDIISFFQADSFDTREIKLYDSLLQLSIFKQFKIIKYKLYLVSFFALNNIKFKKSITLKYKERIGYKKF